MKFCKWRKKMAKAYKRSSDNWLLIASMACVMDVINFMCILGNIELGMSARMFFLQLLVFGICTGVAFTCIAISKANDYRAVRIMNGGEKRETL